MKFRTLAGVAGALALLAVPATSKAQVTCTDTQNCASAVNATVSTVLELSLTPVDGSGNSVTTLGTIGKTEYDKSNGNANKPGAWAATVGPRASVRANTKWQIKAQADADWEQSAVGSGLCYGGQPNDGSGNCTTAVSGKPRADLAIGIFNDAAMSSSTDGDFVQLASDGSATQLKIAGSTAAKAAGLYDNDSALNSDASKALQIEYRTFWDYASDTPGSYTITVKYTIVGA